MDYSVVIDMYPRRHQSNRLPSHEATCPSTGESSCPPALPCWEYTWSIPCIPHCQTYHDIPDLDYFRVHGLKYQGHHDFMVLEKCLCRKLPMTEPSIFRSFLF